MATGGKQKSGAEGAAEAQQKQRNAARPNQSVWVAASAGSGKTKVLTDRVLRLLLADARPERILCLTFTKAAAAEMATRIADRLSSWAVIEEAALARELHDLTGDAFKPEDAVRARRLFATVLDAPGGLQVQTIHGFCQSILRRFPLEAGVTPRFAVLDERTRAERLRNARDQVILTSQKSGETDLAAALDQLSGRVNEDGLAGLLESLISERARLDDAEQNAGGPEALAGRIRALLQVGPQDTDESLIANAVEDKSFNAAALRAAAEALSHGAKTDTERADLIRGWLREEPPGRIASFDEYCKAFLTAKDEIRTRLATKKVQEAAPEILKTLSTEAGRLQALIMRRRAVDVALRTVSLVRVVRAVLGCYRDDKARDGMVDFDDLILTTRDLLARSGVAPWVLYKLDGGLDHVLIDEAQDTNPEQWAIVDHLTAEFFAGMGAAEDREMGRDGAPDVSGRTVFAVGDIKQSIFSFQRADPQESLKMRDHFATRAADAGKGWEQINLDMSFRSSPAVLQAVDAVFAHPEFGDGVREEIDGILTHQAHRAGQAGRVELWPCETVAEEGEARAFWSPPTRQLTQDQPINRLALKIGKLIRGWLDRGEVLASHGRAIRPGDIMILVRRRGPFVDELVRVLKELQVEVAGVDRMILTDQLAVMDLVAFGQFLLLPEDDLTLAAVLKGPLIELSEDRLFELCWGRSGDLWSELRRRRDENEDFRRAHEALSRPLAEVDFTPPYELYSKLLASGGRCRIVERLGVEAGDPIDEFLAQSLAYEQVHVPSLQGFLHWLAAASLEVKRELDVGHQGQVRVMTVHGSKGLQAPIVFLPDAAPTPSAHNRSANLLWAEEEGKDEAEAKGENRSRLPLWATAKDADDPVLAGIRAAGEADGIREYRRLLYVAMTRAEDRLYIGGWEQARASGQANWHDMVKAGMEAAGARDEDGVLILDEAQRDEPDRSFEREALPADMAAVPSWISGPPPTEEHPPRPLTPSRPEEEPTMRSPFDGGNAERFQRGRIIHYLLQTLPAIAPARREEVARTYLARPTHGLTEADQKAWCAEVLALISDPQFADLFSGAAMVETRITGRVGEGENTRIISGQIDRLLVEEDRVLVVDYKTNRPPPEKAEDVSGTYIRQMAAYRLLLREVYPERTVQCALLWTDGPHLMAVPDALLDAVTFTPPEALSSLDG